MVCCSLVDVQIVRGSSFFHASDRVPLLRLELEDSPSILDPRSNADFRCTLELQPLSMVISPLFLDALVSFFYEKDSSYLVAAAASWEQSARSDALAALTDHRQIDLTIRIQQPTVLIPTDALTESSTVLIADLQSLTIRSQTQAVRVAPSMR